MDSKQSGENIRAAQEKYNSRLEVTTIIILLII